MSELGEMIRGIFVQKLRKSKDVKRIMTELAEEASHSGIEELSGVTGTLLRQAFEEVISELNFPVGDVSQILGMIAPALETNHTIVTEAAASAQKVINASQGTNLKAVIPKFDKKTAMNVAAKMAKAETYEDAKWMLDGPIESMAMEPADLAVRTNAEKQRRLGFKKIVIRTCEPGACEWCQMLEGTYDYDEVRDKGNPVWQRHARCLCEIEVVDDPNQPYEPDDWYAADEEQRDYRVRSSEEAAAEAGRQEAAARAKRIARSRQT